MPRPLSALLVLLPALAFAEDPPRIHPVRLGDPPPRHGDYISSLAAGSGGFVTVGGEGSIRAWESGKGWAWRELVPDDGDNGPLAATPDGKLVAGGIKGASIRIWDGETFRKLRDLEGAGVFAKLAFSPDGRALATGDEKGSILIRSAESGEVLARHELEGEIRALAFSADGSLVAASDDKGLVVVLEASTGKESIRLDDSLNDYPVESVEFSPDGKRLFTSCSTRVLTFWDLAKREVAGRWDPPVRLVRFCRFTPDGRSLAVFSDEADSMDGEVWGGAGLYDPESGELQRRIERAFGTVNGAAFSPDGKTLALGGGGHAGALGVGQLMLVEGKTLARILMTSGHEDPVITVDWSADGSRLVSSSWDGTAIVWDVRMRRAIMRTEPDPIALEAAAISPDGKLVATASNSGGVPVRLFDTATGKKVRELPAGSERIVALDFSTDGRRLAFGGLARRTAIFDPTDGNLIADITERKPTCSLAFSPDGRFLAVKGGATGIVIRSASDGTWLRTLQAPTGSEHGYGLLAWSPDSREIVSTADDDPAVVTEVASGKMALTIPDGPDCLSLSLSPDGRFVAAGSYEHFRILSLATGRTVLEYAWPGREFNAIAFSPDGRTLATGDSIGSVFLWDISAIVSEGEMRLPGPDSGNAWRLLASRDAGEARRAQAALADEARRLRDDGADIRSLLGTLFHNPGRRRKPAATDALRQLIAGLDSDDPGTRTEAFRALRAHPDDAEGALLEASRGTLSAEARSQVEAVLSRLERPFTTNHRVLRRLRAIAALEEIALNPLVANGEAQAAEVRAFALRTLRDMAKDDRPRRTQAEAQAALGRLARKEVK